MGKLKKWVRTGLQAFAPTGVLLGAIIALIGGYQSMTGTTLSSLAAVQTISLSAVILIVCGAIVILRHEYLMRELDSYIGNDHARRLWADGIPPLREEYLRYVRRGDFGIVNRFWSAGTVNVEGDGGVSDLHIACEIGNVAIVQGLLERGARPGRSSNAGITPLMYAAIDGHHRVAEVLLQHNCAINATSTDAGCSALYVAAAHGHLPFVELLIREGANKDSVDHDNMTPLMAALAQGHWAVACNLLAAGG